ncbi:MAG: 3'(2'),5'-bisphosphate nucleotidase CysQ [Rikenellaceae bacterium]|nr:3'(2'),5'-bisphosphate nucleotidase CysQ [Rikenellaceae bacterium]
MLHREQLDYLLTCAYNAAVRAGAKILEIYNQDNFNINLKSDSTPITLADKEAHRLIKKYLNQTRIPLLSEEGRYLLFEERCNWDLFWLIDPLDGTKEFIKRNGEFTVNIALMIDNNPFLSVVYAPCFEKLYFSDKEKGSFVKDDIKPDLNAEYTISEIYSDANRLPLVEKPNEPVKIVISRSHLSPETYEFIEEIKKQHGEVEVLQSGSSLKFCMVAEGSADYYVRTTTTYEWDTAAGDSVAISAGCSTHSIKDREVIKYNKENLENPYFYAKTKFINLLF